MSIFLKSYKNLLHFFSTQVNITTILGGGFILDILDIIFEARLNDVATLSEEDKTNTPYHSNSTAAYEKIEALLGDFCPDNAYDVLVAIDDFGSESIMRLVILMKNITSKVSVMALVS